MSDIPYNSTQPHVWTPAELFERKVRPEFGAGGYAHDDSGVEFYTRVNAILQPEMTVVDLGAGRGQMFDGEEDYFMRLIKLQGKVAKVIGLDVDDAIAQHPYLDERHVIGVSDPYPLADQSVDMIVSDWVLEHIAAPEAFAAEVARVLKPGGWLCARTPNRWSYVGIGASLIPNSLHSKLLGTLWPARADHDVFPTVYKLNTRRQIGAHFPAAGWSNFSYVLATTPRYHANQRALFGMIDLYQSLVPSGLKTDLIVMLQKRA
jgi:SAM-dependent methyltransferase